MINRCIRRLDRCLTYLVTHPEAQGRLSEGAVKNLAGPYQQRDLYGNEGNTTAATPETAHPCLMMSRRFGDVERRTRCG